MPQQSFIRFEEMIKGIFWLFIFFFCSSGSRENAKNIQKSFIVGKNQIKFSTAGSFKLNFLSNVFFSVGKIGTTSERVIFWFYFNRGSH